MMTLLKQGRKVLARTTMEALTASGYLLKTDQTKVPQKQYYPAILQGKDETIMVSEIILAT